MIKSNMASDFKDSSTDADESDYNVVIVGAGVTGLGAAHYILQKKAGISVLVLEGNMSTDLVGGRLLSPAESNAYFAHPLQTHITSLLDSLQIPREVKREIGDRSKIIYTKRGPRRKDLPHHTAQQMCYFLKLVNSCSKNPEFGSYADHEDAEMLAKMSVDTLLRSIILLPEARSLCGSLIYATCGMKNFQKISALWFMVMLHGAGGLLKRLRVSLGDKDRYFIKGGMAKLVEELVRMIKQENGEIFMADPVVKVQFNDDRAYVSTVGAFYKCDFVIIAVPPPENTQITIDPPLPFDLMRSQVLYEHGDSTFFTIQYARPFWHDNEFTGDVLATLDSYTNLRIAYDATHPAHSHESVLAGFLAYPNELRPRRFNVFRTLDRCFRTAEADRFTAFSQRMWLPYNFFVDKDGTGGGGSPMSGMKPSRIDFHINSLLQPHGRVYFAASEYAKSWPGTVDGALEAGEEIACIVLMNLRPQSLNLLEITEYVEPKTKAVRPAAPFEFAMVQYIFLGFNIIIFYIFLRAAYGNAA